MKKIIICIALIFIASYCQAQCVAEIKDVFIDEVRGSIIVETQYTLNGVVVQQGQTRYLETSGTNEEIIIKAKSDIENHCEMLVKRIENNKAYVLSEMLKHQKSLTTPIITDIRDDLIGEKKTVTEAIKVWKGKEMKVTYDEKNTTNITVSP